VQNIKLTLEYDGTHFCGWQLQPSDRTVQGELKQAIKQITGEETNIIGSGRTDSGVHAKEQVANFLTNTRLEPKQIKTALNGILPKDVRILAAETVADNFNARFDAIKREYHYTISTYDSAIGRQYFWYCRYNLDVPKMRQAAQYLLGLHDFKSFCQSGSDVNHYICSVEYLDWQEKDHFIMLKIISNRFLHNMVRIIVGTLIHVGRGKIEPIYIQKILDKKDRAYAGQTVPAKGLCLIKVYY